MGLAIAAISIFAACQKEQVAIPDKADVVTIQATYEHIISDGTKVAIDEDGSIFTLSWKGDEGMTVASSSNNATKEFKMSSHGGKTAEFDGTLPGVGDATTTNYVGVVSSFCSSTNANVRGAIAISQDYAEANIGKNALLVARADDATVGTVPSFAFKIMNGFLKISLKKVLRRRDRLMIIPRCIFRVSLLKRLEENSLPDDSASVRQPGIGQNPMQKQYPVMSLRR